MKTGVQPHEGISQLDSPKNSSEKRKTSAENKTAGAGPASEANENKLSIGPAGFADGEDQREDKQRHEETESKRNLRFKIARTQKRGIAHNCNKISFSIEKQYEYK
jgi:hypothetical protein